MTAAHMESISTDESMIQSYRRLFMPVENPLPVIFESGEGPYCFDTTQRRYLDFGAGLGVNALGYGNAGIRAAVLRQVDRLIHCGAESINAPAVCFARMLEQRIGFDSFFFSNSGAEANEAALKLARRYFSANGQPERYEIVTLDGAFHGRTLFTVSAAGNPNHCRHFGPLVPGLVHAEFNRVPVLRAAVGERTAAILVETMQTRHGVRELDPELVACINELRQRHGLLVIVDEIQTGWGRTGDYLSSRAIGLDCDVVTLGKGLGGGFPIGVTATHAEIGAVMNAGAHGTTFGGGPLIMEVACAVAEQLSAPGFLPRVRELGGTLRKRLDRLVESRSDLTPVTGRGLMLGIGLRNRLEGRAAELQGAALARGLIIRTSGPTALRFTPPLNIDASHIDEAMNKLVGCIDQVAARAGAVAAAAER
jgi:acetylornithine/N-succinyldiaminopimelate aminotransferase